MDFLEKLLLSKSPLAISVSIGSVIYVLRDLLGRSKRMDKLIASVKSISDSLLLLTADLTKDKQDLVDAKDDIKDIKSDLKEYKKDHGVIAHRLVRVETRQQLIDIQKGEPQ